MRGTWPYAGLIFLATIPTHKNVWTDTNLNKSPRRLKEALVLQREDYWSCWQPQVQQNQFSLDCVLFFKNISLNLINLGWIKKPLKSVYKRMGFSNLPPGVKSILNLKHIGVKYLIPWSALWHCRHYWLISFKFRMVFTPRGLSLRRILL